MSTFGPHINMGVWGGDPNKQGGGGGGGYNIK